MSGDDHHPRDGDRAGGIGGARRYAPRGRSVRDVGRESERDDDRRRRTASRRNERESGRESERDDDRRRRAASRRSERDAFRPALRLVEGGAAQQPQRRTAAARERNRRRVAEAPAAPKPVARSAQARQTQRRAARVAPPPRAAEPRRVVKRRLPRIGDPKRRLRFGMVLIMLVFVVVGGRLVQLQVTDAAAYAAGALDQRLREEVVPGSRGAIVDRNGELLAFSADARYVYADPEDVAEADEAAEMLSPLLGQPESDLVDKLQSRTLDDGTQSRFEYLARGVDISVAETITGLEIPGIHVAHDERREVPGHDLAANVIGFTGLDGEGLDGLEASYDEILQGRDGERMYEVSPSGQEIPGGFHREDPPQSGDDLELTVDSDLQYQVQRIVDDTMEEQDAEFATAVVMEASTGDVVSMASVPTYDAADPFDYDEDLRVDWASGAVMEPGSVHKALVVGAALEEGLIEPDEAMTVAPTIQKGDETYRDSHYHEEMPMSLGGILAHSSNVGTIMLADSLGADTVYEYQQRFGLGEPTGVGVDGEAAGIVRPPGEWSGTDYGSVPIGLGVAATPLQMTAAYNAIANDGVYVQPNIVQCRISESGERIDVAAPQERRVLSTEVAKDMQHLLQAPVTVPDGTGTEAELPGYLMAGKTGTGMLVRDGEYADGDVAGFVGFAPADDPQYTVAVFAYTPEGGGGTVTGAAFRDVMQATMGHFRVAPSDEEPAEFEVFP